MRATSVLIPLLATLLFVPTARAQCEVSKLLSGDAGIDDVFGRGVALGGGRALVGSRYDKELGQNAGAAFVFEPSPAGWELTAKLVASDPDPEDWFGQSVAIDGSHAIVGAHLDDGAGDNAGAAYVFQYDGNDWVEIEKLTAFDAFPGDQFGFSVDISGDTAIVGAYQADGDVGAVYVFQEIAGGWGFETKLAPAAPDPFDFFGRSVAIDGNRILVGSVKDDDAGADAGAVYVYEYSFGFWSNTAKLFAADAQAGDQFGYDVALSGDTAVVGAPFEDQQAGSAGAAYVLGKIAGDWIQEAKLTDPLGNLNDFFGSSVAVHSDVALVGSPRDADGGFEAGSVFQFERIGAGWPQTGHLLASDAQAGDQFGFFVALDASSGDSVYTGLVGAPFEDQEADLAGAAYTFTLDTGQPLFACPPSISLLADGVQDYSLRAGPGNGAKLYMILGSASGTAPGLPVDLVVLPLNPDPYFTFTLQNPNTLIAGSLGFTNAVGEATAALALPPASDPNLAGLVLHHAYLVFDAAFTAVFASNPESLALID